MNPRVKSVKALEDYKLELYGGGGILLNGKYDPNTILKDLLLAVETKKEEHPDLFENLEYIDVRFIDLHKVYFKMAN